MAGFTPKQKDLRDAHLKKVNELYNNWVKLYKRAGLDQEDWDLVKERMEAEANRAALEDVVSDSKILLPEIQKINNELEKIASQSKIVSKVSKIKTVGDLNDDETGHEILRTIKALLKERPEIWHQMIREGAHSKYPDKAITELWKEVKVMQGESKEQLRQWRRDMQSYGQKQVKLRSENDDLKAKLAESEKLLKSLETEKNEIQQDQSAKANRIRDLERQIAQQPPPQVPQQSPPQAPQQTPQQAPQQASQEFVNPFPPHNTFTPEQKVTFMKAFVMRVIEERNAYEWAAFQKGAIPTTGAMDPESADFVIREFKEFQKTGRMRKQSFVVSVESAQQLRKIQELRNELAAEREQRDTDQKRDQEARQELEETFNSQIATLKGDLNKYVGVEQRDAGWIAAVNIFKTHLEHTQIKITASVRHLRTVDPEMRIQLDEVKNPSVNWIQHFPAIFDDASDNEHMAESIEATKQYFYNEDMSTTIQNFAVYLMEQIIAREEKCKMLEQEKATLKEKIADDQAGYDRDRQNEWDRINFVLDHKQQTHDEKIGELKADKQLLKQQIDQETKKLNQAQLEHIKELSKANGEAEIQKKAADYAEKRVLEYNQSVFDKDQEIKRLHEQEVAATKREENATNQLANEKNSHEFTKVLVENLKQEADEMKETLEKLKGDSAKAQAQDTAQQVVNDLVNGLKEDRKKDREEYKEQRDNDQQRIKDLQDKVEEHVGTIGRLGVDIAKQDNKINNLESDVSQRNRQIEEKDGDLQNLREAKTNLERDIISTQSEVDQMKLQRDNFDQQKNELQQQFDELTAGKNAVDSALLNVKELLFKHVCERGDWTPSDTHLETIDNLCQRAKSITAKQTTLLQTLRDPQQVELPLTIIQIAIASWYAMNNPAYRVPPIRNITEIINRLNEATVPQDRLRVMLLLLLDGVLVALKRDGQARMLAPENVLGLLWTVHFLSMFELGSEELKELVDTLDVTEILDPQYTSGLCLVEALLAVVKARMAGKEIDLFEELGRNEILQLDTFSIMPDGDDMVLFAEGSAWLINVRDFAFRLKGYVIELTIKTKVLGKLSHLFADLESDDELHHKLHEMFPGALKRMLEEDESEDEQMTG